MNDSLKLARGALLWSGDTTGPVDPAILKGEAKRRGIDPAGVIDVAACAVARLEINGVRVAVVGAQDVARRVFASTPARVIRAELDALGADVAVAAGLLPFTRSVAGGLWHSVGAFGRPANDGTQRVWFSVVTPGEGRGALVFEHVAVPYEIAAPAGAEVVEQERVSGLWSDCAVLPKEDLKLRGVALEPALLVWAPGSADFVWPPVASTKPIAAGKFEDPRLTAAGERRAHVPLDALRTLWINTGTLCNLSCASCYIESTPRNDRLAYIMPAEVRTYLDEIARDGLPTHEIGFTGGEPFLNPGFVEMLEETLARGFSALVLTNAMKPMRLRAEALLALNARFAQRLTMRVSLDHYTPRLHELERGPRSWEPALEGLRWLCGNGFRVHIAGRMYSGETEAAVREGYRALFAEHGLSVDAADPIQLVLFPEMDETVDVPEITEACWGILHKSPSDVMCASSRMVVKRKGADAPTVLACTLLAYDERFELGRTLAQASGDVALNHPHCAKFCVLGGAACSRA